MEGIRENLSQWNNLQAELWSTIVARGYAEKNDVKVFKQFALFFSSYFEEYHITPLFKEIILYLGLNR